MYINIDVEIDNADNSVVVAVVSVVLCFTLCLSFSHGFSTNFNPLWALFMTLNCWQHSTHTQITISIINLSYNTYFCTFHFHSLLCAWLIKNSGKLILLQRGSLIKNTAIIVGRYRWPRLPFAVLNRFFSFCLVSVAFWACVCAVSWRQESRRPRRRQRRRS